MQMSAPRNLGPQGQNRCGGQQGWNNFLSLLSKAANRSGLERLVRQVTRVDEPLDLSDAEDEELLLSRRMPFWDCPLATSMAYDLVWEENELIDGLSEEEGGLTTPEEYWQQVRRLHVVLPLSLLYGGESEEHFGMPFGVLQTLFDLRNFPQMEELKLQVSFGMDDLAKCEPRVTTQVITTLQRLVGDVHCSSLTECEVRIALTDRKMRVKEPEVKQAYAYNTPSHSVAATICTLMGEWHDVPH